MRGIEDARNRGHEDARMRGIEDAKNGGHEEQMTQRIEDARNTGLEEWRMHQGIESAGGRRREGWRICHL